MHRRIAEVLWCWWISGSYFHTGPNTGIYSSPSFHPFPSDSKLPRAYFPPPPPRLTNPELHRIHFHAAAGGRRRELPEGTS